MTKVRLYEVYRLDDPDEPGLYIWEPEDGSPVLAAPVHQPLKRTRLGELNDDRYPTVETLRNWHDKHRTGWAIKDITDDD